MLAALAPHQAGSSISIRPARPGAAMAIRECRVERHVFDQRCGVCLAVVVSTLAWLVLAAPNKMAGHGGASHSLSPRTVLTLPSLPVARRLPDGPAERGAGIRTCHAGRSCPCYAPGSILHIRAKRDPNRAPLRTVVEVGAETPCVLPRARLRLVLFAPAFPMPHPP